MPVTSASGSQFATGHADEAPAEPRDSIDAPAVKGVGRALRTDRAPRAPGLRGSLVGPRGPHPVRALPRAAPSGRPTGFPQRGDGLSEACPPLVECHEVCLRRAGWRTATDHASNGATLTT